MEDATYRDLGVGGMFLGPFVSALGINLVLYNSGACETSLFSTCPSWLMDHPFAAAGFSLVIVGLALILFGVVSFTTHRELLPPEASRRIAPPPLSPPPSPLTTS